MRIEIVFFVRVGVFLIIFFWVLVSVFFVIYIYNDRRFLLLGNLNFVNLLGNLN